MKRRVPLLIALSAAAALGLWRLAQGPQDPGETWFVARQERLASELTEVGILEARSLARILSPLSGILAEIPEDGSLVKAGDLLFRIDDESMRVDLEGQQTELDLKLQDLERIRGELAVITNSYIHVRQREQAEWDHAELDLAFKVRGLSPEDRRMLEIAIARADLELEEKRETLARTRELVERGFAFASALDTPARDVAAAEAFLEEKKTQLILESQPLLEEERIALQAAVDQARDVVERSGKRHQRDVARKRMELQAQSVEIEHLRGKMEQVQQQLKDVRVLAPVSGVIRVMRSLNWTTGTWLTLGTGQNTSRLNVLGDILDPADLLVRVLIHESDIRQVATGMVARIQLTAYSGHALTGRVEQVTSLGQDRSDLAPLYRQAPPSFQAQFLAVIRFDPGGLDLRPGMTATVSLETEPVRTHLVIPREALLQNTPPWQVLRKRGNRQETVTVDGRFRRDGWFQIDAGLDAGDAVLLHRESPP
jgi:multidrug resistance efflux pump